MLSFKKINADNMMQTAQFYNYKISRTSDYTVGGIYMWRDFYDASFAIYEDMILYKVEFLNRTSFTYPIGSGSFAKAMEALKEYCKSNDLPLWFCTVPEEVIPVLTNEFHGTIPGTPPRDWADYLYCAEDLAQMAGRRYSGQRNHINKFLRLYPNYQYHEITPDNINRVIDFLKDYQIKFGKEASLAQKEFKGALEIMPLLDKFKLPGGFIEVDGEIIAMSVGEIIKDTLYCHIEKANRNYEGAYQMIVREFARHNVTEEVKYINREEDVGDEGLRKSKLSYHPTKLLDKYCVLVPYN